MKPIDDTILASCSVAPGFEFEDFELIDKNISDAKLILNKFPQLKKLV